MVRVTVTINKEKDGLWEGIWEKSTLLHGEQNSCALMIWMLIQQYMFVRHEGTFIVIKTEMEHSRR